MRIDAHHHLWHLARGDYDWLTPRLAAIHRDFTPSDLAPLLNAAGITGTVLIQAAPSVAETEFLLDIAADTDWIAGVLGWIDMDTPDALEVLDRLRAHPKFRGIRPMIQDIARDDWILSPGLDAMFQALISWDLSFDALVLPRHLPHLLARLAQHPDLRCVINHGAKPNLAGGDLAAWKQDIARIAAETRCFCKLSGLLTEAGSNPTLETIRPAAEHILAAFGPDRVMFGSDWPVLNLAGTYSGWTAMVENILSPLPDRDREAVWGRTAAAFYGLA